MQAKKRGLNQSEVYSTGGNIPHFLQPFRSDSNHLESRAKIFQTDQLNARFIVEFFQWILTKVKQIMFNRNFIDFLTPVFVLLTPVRRMFWHRIEREANLFCKQNKPKINDKTNEMKWRMDVLFSSCRVVLVLSENRQDSGVVQSIPTCGWRHGHVVLDTADSRFIDHVVWFCFVCRLLCCGGINCIKC